MDARRHLLIQLCRWSIARRRHCFQRYHDGCLSASSMVALKLTASQVNQPIIELAELMFSSYAFAPRF